MPNEWLSDQERKVTQCHSNQLIAALSGDIVSLVKFGMAAA